MREPQTAANAGAKNDPSRAFEAAQKLFWNLGSKLIDNELPMFKGYGMNLLTQLSQADPRLREWTHGGFNKGPTTGIKRPGVPSYDQNITEQGVQGFIGRHDPNLGNELMDRWERNLNSSRMNPAEFMAHFNKNRMDRPGWQNLTPTALVRYMASKQGGPANPSPGFEYNPNPTYST